VWANGGDSAGTSATTGAAEQTTDAAKELAAVLALKTRVLIDGVAVDARIKEAGPYRERVEHLYRHDRGELVPFPYPQEIVLSMGRAIAGPDPVVANIRSNPRSKLRLTARDGLPFLDDIDGAARQVGLFPPPPFYARLLADGGPASRVAQMLGADLVGIVPNNHCHYFVNGAECVFCEIVPNYWRARTFRMIRKPQSLEVEALRLAVAPENGVRCVVITPGNHARLDRTAELIGELARSIVDCPGRDRLFVYGSQMAPETFDMIDRLEGWGFDGVGFNLEAWEPAAMRRIAPGKFAYGRERMLEALSRAVSVFGAGNVYSNLVYGVQSLDEELTAGSFDPRVERERCLEATVGLLALGVLPIFTIYHYSGHNRIGPIALDVDEAIRFHREYGRLVDRSDLVPATRTGVLFNLGSITNHVYNDALALARAENRVRMERGTW
jgi:hypothetical protein